MPIVLAGGLDPVKIGLATNLRQPDRNVTGFTTQVIDITGKMFEVLSKLLPALTRIGIVNPKRAGASFRDAETAAAKALKINVAYFEIDNFEAEALDKMLQRATVAKAQALLVRGSPFFSTPQRKAIIERVAAHRIPAMYETREFTELGGLVSYGTDFSALFREAAGYVVKILKGANVRDLPIEQASKFELVLNVKTAKALGIAVPPAFIALADEVIE